jgi:hypothetical protein
MTGEASSAAAPIDRPAGRRGWRGTLAGVAAIAIVPCVGAATAYETGGGSRGSTSFDYRLDGPGWTHTALIVAAIGLAASAVLVWTVRRRALLVLGLALIPLAIGGAVWAVVKRSHTGRVEVSEMRAIEIGMSHAEVRQRLGSPAGHATLGRRGGERQSCELYRGKPKDRFGDHRDFALCFSSGRLTDRAAF